ncbi:hypothetical protein PG993_008025 [Apiospora rasikravindrae]|uniref:Uncharacterized protein n=1 Tax=Apiospora rasikravindrae TaxID=990691 RepID=A0ABR1SZ66_9PEZI
MVRPYPRRVEYAPEIVDVTDKDIEKHAIERKFAMGKAKRTPRISLPKSASTASPAEHKTSESLPAPGSPRTIDLVRGRERLKVLPDVPEVHAGNVQTWVHLPDAVAASSSAAVDGSCIEKPDGSFGFKQEYIDQINNFKPQPLESILEKE